MHVFKFIHMHVTYIHRYGLFVISDGALWFWSVIKTIMTDWSSLHSYSCGCMHMYTYTYMRLCYSLCGLYVCMYVCTACVRILMSMYTDVLCIIRTYHMYANNHACLHTYAMEGCKHVKSEYVSKRQFEYIYIYICIYILM